ncbi:TPA: hypothetical protein ACXXZZ_002439, partial [Enterococcus faecium]
KKYRFRFKGGCDRSDQLQERRLFGKRSCDTTFVTALFYWKKRVLFFSYFTIKGKINNKKV